MAIITDITPQKKDKLRVNIYLDGSFYCGLQMETVYNYGLKVNKELTPEELDEIQFSSEKSQAFDKALTYISKMMKTKKQIKEYLAGKGYTTPVINYCIERMTEYKFIDDLEYCKAYVRTYRENKGKKLIENELRLKGIDFNLVSKAIEEEGIDQHPTVKKIAEKYFKGKDPTKENFAKLYKYILSKGFSYEEASYAITCVKGDGEWNEY